MPGPDAELVKVHSHGQRADAAGVLFDRRLSVLDREVGRLQTDVASDTDVAAGELLEQMLPWLSVGLLNCLERGGLQGVGSDRQPPSEDPDAPPGPLLSRRQGQVAELLKKGLRNRQIAQELGLSVHTVEIHVTAVLR
jgi:hypothetical protein